jgi:hypothetical protein
LTSDRSEPPERRLHPVASALLAGFVPGLVAGTQIAGLLFFLNPDLPFSAFPLVRSIAVFGLLLGLVSTALLAPWSWLRRGLTARILPWALSVVLGAAAAIDWFHAAHFTFYLPPGINIRLIKAAAWLSLASLICFYTALLHSLHGRRYGRRSRIGLALLALASVYVMVERREAFHAPMPVNPRPSTVATGVRPRLVMVGIDSATLDALLPLAEQGELPFFHALLQQGAYGRLTTISPVRPDALWTTLATGQLPYRHGILAANALPAVYLPRDPLLRLPPSHIAFQHWARFGARPVAMNATNRRSLAAWEILPRLGIHTALVGWPVSAPLPPDLVFGFSAGFFSGEFTATSATPPEAAERGLLFRLAPDDLDPALKARLGATPPAAALHALSSDLWRETLTSFLLDQHPDVDALLLDLPGLREISALAWGGYAATQFHGDNRPQAQAAARLVAAYYHHLDDYLSRLWAAQPQPRLLVIVSAYGVEEPSAWRQLLTSGHRSRLSGDFRGAPDGLFLLAGNGVRPGAFIDDARLVDVLPTVIYGLGLPIARDLDGRVLTDAWDTAFLAGHPLTFVPSYRTLAAQREGVEQITVLP